MSFLLSCPHCGPRDVNEFRFQREWWYHRVGCGLWFLAERDTRTNEVLRTEIPESAGR